MRSMFPNRPICTLYSLALALVIGGWLLGRGYWRWHWRRRWRWSWRWRWRLALAADAGETNVRSVSCLSRSNDTRSGNFMMYLEVTAPCSPDVMNDVRRGDGGKKGKGAHGGETVVPSTPEPSLSSNHRQATTASKVLSCPISIGEKCGSMFGRSTEQVGPACALAAADKGAGQVPGIMHKICLSAVWGRPRPMSASKGSSQKAACKPAK